MVHDAYNAIVHDGAAWFEEVIDGEDIIASVTDGRMTTVCEYA